MDINFPALLVAALIPLVMGFIWYHDKLFGNTWKVVADMTEEKIKSGNMLLIFGLTYVLSLFAAISLNFIVIHQFSILSVLADEPGLNDPNTEVGRYAADFLAKYGNHFRTFKHGAFHGVLAGLFMALPVLGINALFERKSFKYIAIHAGYWVITFALMGGVICGWK